MQPLGELKQKFEQFYKRKASFFACAPGRVNLLGEHVDYNEGPVLPAAIDRAVHILVAPTADRTVTLAALDLGEQFTFRLDETDRKQAVNGAPLPAWALYPAGVAWALQSAGYPLTGMQAVYTSDVPIGAGLSSSAAVEVGFAFTFQALWGWQANRMELAQLCQKVENDYLGLSSGLMDQFASAFGKAGHALYFDTRSLDWEALPLPPGTALVIADSGIRRTLTTSAYNDRHAACREAVRLLQQFKPEIQSLRDISSVEYAAYEEYLPPEIAKRAEHVVKEIGRVESAVTALKLGKTKQFGALMFAGHASLRDLYEVSLPELDALVQIAHGLPGCLGARLTGAGFGGCTVNLVEEDKAAAFISGLEQGYREKTGGEAIAYLCYASDGASVKTL